MSIVGLNITARYRCKVWSCLLYTSGEVYIEKFQDVKATQPIISFIDIDQLKLEIYVTQDIARAAQALDTIPVSYTHLQGKSSKILKPKWQKSKRAVLRLSWITISPMTYHAFLTPPYLSLIHI